MRLLMFAAAAAALGCVNPADAAEKPPHAVAAREAVPSLVQDLERICIANRADPQAVAARLDAEHWAPALPEHMPDSPGLKSGELQGREHRNIEDLRVAMFGSTELSDAGPGQRVAACMVMSDAANGEDEADDALETLVGAPPVSRKASGAVWAWREHDGRREPVDANDPARLQALAQAGELALLFRQVHKGKTAVVYARFLALDTTPTATPAAER